MGGLACTNREVAVDGMHRLVTRARQVGNKGKTFNTCVYPTTREALEGRAKYGSVCLWLCFAFGLACHWSSCSMATTCKATQAPVPVQQLDTQRALLQPRRCALCRLLYKLDQMAEMQLELSQEQRQE